MAKLFLFYCYVPDSHLERVKEELFALGLGKFKNYSHCSWQVKGFGQFKPLEGSDPFLGNKNTIEQVEEWKVEMLCMPNLKESALDVLKKFHPYEEPAYGFIQIEA